MTERSVDWSSVADLGALPTDTGPTLGSLGAFDDAVRYPPQASDFPPPPKSRMDRAFDTSVENLKQLGKDIFFAPVRWANAPPWEQAMGLIGGIGSKVAPVKPVISFKTRGAAEASPGAAAAREAPHPEPVPGAYNARIKQVSEAGEGPFKEGGYTFDLEGPGLAISSDVYPTREAAHAAAAERIADIRRLQANAGTPDADMARFGVFSAPPQAPYVRRPGAALFDYSRAKGVPSDVEQQPLWRWISPKGPSETGQRVLDDKAVWKKIDEWAARGTKEGGLDWYNVQPFKDAFIEELGPKVGGERFKLWADLMAASSPRTSVPQNAKIASYFYNELVNGRPVPVRVPKPGGGFQLDRPMPEGYGSMAQILHAYNVDNLVREGGWSPAMLRANPKPPSFSENIQGNLRPYTIDAHMTRATKYGADRPTDADYPFLEQRFIERANKMGLESGQHQASAWLGVPETVTKVRPESRASLLEQIERVITSTADQLGTTKPKAMKQFIRAKTPLY